MMSPGSSLLSSSPLAHALQNPVILSALFEHVPVADLKSWRRVSRFWKNTSTAQWRSRRRLILNGKKNRMGRLKKRGVRWYRHLYSEEDDSSNEEGDETGQLDRFLRLLRSAEAENEYKLWSIPFRKLTYHYHYTGYREELQVEFFELYGAHLKDICLSLFLTTDWWDKGPDFKKIFLRLTPNLEKLKVVGEWLGRGGGTPVHEDPFAVPIDDYPPQENLKTFIVEFCSAKRDDHVLNWFRYWFRHFPNMQTLKVTNLVCREDQLIPNQPFVRLLEVLGFIGEIRKESANKQLAITHLDVHKACHAVVRKHTWALVDSFRKAQLPLKTLKIDVGHETEEVVVQELLQMHSSTLQTLHIVRGEYVKPYRNFLGDNGDMTFPNLKDLTLAGAVALNFNFLRNTPNLEVLRQSNNDLAEIGFHDFSGFLFVPESDLSHGFEAGSTDPDLDIRLERMKALHGVFKIKEAAWLEKLAGWMPKLEILDLPLNKETFPVACSSWGDTLRKLTIQRWGEASASVVDDETLTGIPRGWPTRHSRFLMEDRPPNITNLKFLEVFTDCNYPSTSLSNHSICNGFLHLTHLSRIQFNWRHCRPEKVKLSSTNQSKLRKKNISLKFGLFGRD